MSFIKSLLADTDTIQARKAQARNSHKKKNEALLQLYTKHKEIFYAIQKQAQENPSDKIALHLPYVSCAFESSAVRIMVIGQETYGWGFKLDDIQDDIHDNFTQSIERAMDCVGKFQQGDSVYSGRANSSPFWSFINRVYEIFNGKADKKKCRKSSIVWSNLRKICYDDKKRASHQLPKKIQTLIDNHLATLLLEEIRIIQPDMVLFLSGWKYDKYIERLNRLPEIDIHIEAIQSFDYKELAVIKIGYSDLTKITMLRTPHPNYLQLRLPELKKRLITHFNSLKCV